MEYTFRELTSQDIFPMMKLLSKIGVSEFKNCFESEAVKNTIIGVKGKKDDKALASIGITVMLQIGEVLISNIPKCENEIYAILSSVSSIPIEELKKLSMSDFMQMIIDFIKKPEFKDFIKVVSRLFNSEK
ncbi:MAG: hypothetical protein SOY97_05905 [Candidatus Metalachnospira sp.]|nr:hypothetical protein [Candidatus Metalachnospira sp.]